MLTSQYFAMTPMYMHSFKSDTVLNPMFVSLWSDQGYRLASHYIDVILSKPSFFLLWFINWCIIMLENNILIHVFFHELYQYNLWNSITKIGTGSFASLERAPQSPDLRCFTTKIYFCSLINIFFKSCQQQQKQSGPSKF